MVNTFALVLLGFASTAMLLVPFHAVQFNDSARSSKINARPDICQDDPSWSAYGNGQYTCEWLQHFDPGCHSNPCHGYTNFGQCEACPRTCRAPCPAEPPSPPAVHEGLRGSYAASERGVAKNGTSVRLVEDKLPAPVFSLVTEGLLTLAGVLGFLAAAVARRIQSGHEAQIEVRDAQMLGRLSFALIVVHLILGVVVVAHVLTTPSMCMVLYERLVPFSPANAAHGEVVSLSYSNVRVRAVLITTQGLNLLTFQCAPSTLSFFLVGFALLFHLAVIRAMFHRTHNARTTQRVIEQYVLNPRCISTFGELKAAAAKADAELSSDHELNLGVEASMQADGTSGPSPRSAEVALGWLSGEAPECPICIDAFQNTEEVVLLPCRHLLHKDCLVSWTKARMISTACPLCKAPLIPAEALNEDEPCVCCVELRRLNSLRPGPNETAMV
mmetsp:Transcript_81888/g.163024  ORF Transcript_81888/g.163024 Transcript_81888/m.163024 type:complete len:443 (-) Transcript_81888:128-1456(-)|eukprot:CAMPEP_0174695132 /NCGR_PEP_ID=MMETSP1094-20130205/1576_1 /TAXON_ID=156173 /ORGANISM="Chrysochromulina brevifilum, Strain UTEX LB 985" /LENGTH=442 /DNA_ID=CAMNT_0015891557 /DNA_START=33 /DNA_END=1361 /DNA_ORIENTATION=-